VNLGTSSRLPDKCVYSDCPSIKASPNSVHIVRKGFYFRSSDSKQIHRYFCYACRRSFSSASWNPCFRQKRRNLNRRIQLLRASGVSQRRTAFLIGANRKTVVRKGLFMAEQAKLRHKEFLSSFESDKNKFAFLQMDEMESFEKSKCLPVSIPIIVAPRTRKILAIGVCSMPAKGLLAEFSRKKYGFRVDERSQTMSRLLRSISHVTRPDVCFLTDENPKYPKWLKSVFPHAKHITTKGRRGCTVGQGELKRGGYDPLFDLNHTCAMIRANVSRLFRRTWNTTKKRERLEADLALYVDIHNSILT